VTDSEAALRAALEAAGLSLQAIPEEQRMSLTEEEVTRLIGLRAGRPTTGPAALSAEEAAGKDAAASTDPVTPAANSDA
jgi:hypothetical protein